MKNKLFLQLSFAFFLMALGGCSSTPSTLSSTPDFSSLSIITFGQKPPANQEFIIFFPAGNPIPTSVSIMGNAFSQQAKANLTVTLKKDLYEYKEWVSFDGKSWVKGKDAIDFTIDIKVPGHAYPKAGQIAVHMSIK